jgi:hypothetical protein
MAAARMPSPLLRRHGEDKHRVTMPLHWDQRPAWTASRTRFHAYQSAYRTRRRRR